MSLATSLKCYDGATVGSVGSFNEKTCDAGDEFCTVRLKFSSLKIKNKTKIITYRKP